MSYDGNEVPAPVLAASGASSPAVLQATNKLYEAALLIRGMEALYATDIRDYLEPALKQLSRAVGIAAERSRVPAIERPTPSVIQRGPDKAADLLRAAASGADIRF